MRSFNTDDLRRYSKEELKTLKEELVALRKLRHKQYIAPLEKQHIKPLKEKYINPIKKEHIQPINDALKEVNKYLPNQKYWRFQGSVFGPMPKTKLLKMIQEVDAPAPAPATAQSQQ